MAEQKTEEKKEDRKDFVNKKIAREKIPEKKAVEQKEQLIEIVRILSTDLNGRLKIRNSLRKIKGISFMTAKVFCEKAKIDPNTITGQLTEEQIKRLEEVVKNPAKFGVPKYMMNMRKSPYTGEDGHFTGAELQIETRKILGDMKKLGSYVGIRHRLGQPVRGQRTRSSFRENRSVGVSKKKQAPSSGGKSAK